MNLFKFLALLPIIPSTIEWGKYSYETLKYWSLPKEAQWDEKQALQNFKLISQSTPKQLPNRICSKRVLQMTPFLNHATFGYETKAEYDATLMKVATTGGIAAGTGAFLLPIAQYLNRCLATDTIGVCAKSGIGDLCSYSALRLFSGAFLIAQFVTGFLIAPVVQILMASDLPGLRILRVVQEYGAMLKALNEILDLPVDDPKFIETAKLAKLFLRLSPYIEKELHRSLALDLDDAKKLLLLLKSACRQILVKKAYPVPSEAKSPIAPSPEAAPPLDPKATVKTP